MLTNNRTIDMLIQYNAWTNKLIFEAVSKIPPLETCTEDNQSFGSIMRLLNHNYIVARIWQAHLEGHEHGFKERNPKEYPPCEKLWLLQQPLDQWFINYCNKLTSQMLSEQVRFILIGGTSGVMTREEILLHIVNHTTYHRGFIADIFYKISAKPPTTDLTIFLTNRK